MSISAPSAEARPNRPSLLVTLGLLTVALFGIRTISNSDFWMHLATGRHVVQHGFPKADPFSFTTDTTRPWINPSWLYDVLLYLLWRIGRAPVVILAHVAAVTGAFALLSGQARRLGSNISVAAALVLIAWFIAPSFAVGPTAIVLLLTAIFIRTLERGMPGAAGMAMLCGLQVAWTNIHTSFLLGPLLALLYVTQAWMSHKHQPPGSSAAVRSGLWLAVLLLVSTLVNPYFLALHRYAVQTMSNPNLSVMLEWISPFQTEFLPFAARHASTALLVVVAAGFIVVRGRLPIAATSLAVLSAFLVVLSPRYFEFSAIMAFPFLALSLSAVGAWLASRGPQNSRLLSLLGRIAVLLAIALTAAAVASGYYFNRTGSASGFGLGAAEDLFPKGACEHIVGRPDFPKRAINLAMDGGYLAWKQPDRRVFTDTRGSVYGVTFYQGLGFALLGQTNTWNNLMDRWNPEAVILNCAWPGSGAAARRLLDEKLWGLAYYDGITAVLVTRTADHARLLNDLEAQSEGLISLENARRRYEDAVKSRCAPRNPPQLIGAGAVTLALWRFQEAEAVYGLLTRGAPTMATAWLNLGICQYHRRAYREAADTLHQASRIRPQSVLAWLWLSKSYAALDETDLADAAMARARKLNPTLADTFEAGFQPATNTTLPGVSIEGQRDTP